MALYLIIYIVKGGLMVIPAIRLGTNTLSHAYLFESLNIVMVLAVIKSGK